MKEVTGPLADLVEWLTAFPEHIPELCNTIRQMQDPNLCGLVVHAMAGVPDPASVGALTDILANPSGYPSAATAQAVLATADLGSRASPEVLEALRALTNVDADVGGYDLGDMATNAYVRLAKDDPERRASLIAAVQSQLSADNHEGDKRSALAVLATLQAEDPQAEALLADSIPEVRSEAATYVGTLPPTPGRDAALIGLLQNDQDTTVRQAAAAALEREDRPQSPSVKDALRRN